MKFQPVMTPGGHLIVEATDATSLFDERTISDSLQNEIRAAFALSSAAGLVCLVTQAGSVALPGSFVYWRDFAQSSLRPAFNLEPEALQHAVRGRPSAEASAFLLPSDETLRRLVENVPPMQGIEYITPEVLARLWRELQHFVLQQAGESADGAEAYLKRIDPLRSLLGRVTFHLAENRRNSDRPFAFLATYSTRISAEAKLQHLPLAEALQQYAGSKAQDKLTALLRPVQQAAAESPLVREFLDSRRLFQPQALTIREAHRFLTEVPMMEAAGLAVRVPNWWRAKQAPRPAVQLRIGERPVSEVGVEGLLDFQVDLALEGEPLTEDERDQLLQATEGLAFLRGQWVEVDPQKLREALDHWRLVEEEYADGISFVNGMRMLAGLPTEGEVAPVDVAEWTRISAGDWLGDILRQLRDPSGTVDCQPGQDLQATLRPYQVDGVRWLWFMTRLGLGGCLADDMGLGKTIQVIDLLLMLKRESQVPARRKSSSSSPAPSLLVVPASLVGNWKAEFERFAPTLRVLYAHRSESDRDLLDSLATSTRKVLQQYDAVVTTYGLARRTRWAQEMGWSVIVLDEAQAIKNASSAQSRSMRRLKGTARIALSGTPVENHLGELWSLFDFCCPGLLGNSSQFKKFAKTLSSQQQGNAYAPLRKLVRPYILRRLKTDPEVIADLPAKVELRAECTLSKRQVVLYEKTLDELEQRLDAADGMARRGIVLATLLRLKQICNHPALFLQQTDFTAQDSGKFQRLEQVCQPVIDRQERMLVFTQFQSMTDPLASFLAEVFGRDGLVLHGGVPVKKRKELVAQFQQDHGPPFFVISVKAGGVGLNLTAASHVVHFDRWWNPAVENQATDRAFRIGQKRNVLVHKFVCRGTVEERIDAMIRDKQQLADKILGQGAEVLLTEMSDRELLDFVALDLSRAGSDDA